MASYEDYIRRASEHPQTRDDLVKYYSTRYGDDWSRHLAAAIQPYTQGKNGQPQSIRNIQRRFQNRGNRKWYTIAPSKAAQAQYQALGAQNHVPLGGYRGHVDADICVSGDCGNARSWDFHITGAAAQELANGNDKILTQAYSQKPGKDHVFSLSSPAPGADFTEGFGSRLDLS